MAFCDCELAGAGVVDADVVFEVPRGATCFFLLGDVVEAAVLGGLEEDLAAFFACAARGDGAAVGCEAYVFWC